jgi:hypothetical protein
MYTNDINIHKKLISKDISEKEQEQDFHRLLHDNIINISYAVIANFFDLVHNYYKWQK